MKIMSSSNTFEGEWIYMRHLDVTHTRATAGIAEGVLWDTSGHGKQHKQLSTRYDLANPEYRGMFAHLTPQRRSQSVSHSHQLKYRLFTTAQCGWIGFGHASLCSYIQTYLKPIC